MSRIAKPGIIYYSMDVNNVTNKRVKLLFNEFDAEGYWIWNCLLCQIYGESGYFYNTTDREELILFATDVCKKKVSLVDEVIKGCIRRGLFDETVFNSFGVLTSDRIQTNYLDATKDRRKKGIIIDIFSDYLLIKIPENEKNINILGINADSSREESPIFTGGMQQSKVKERKEKKSKAEERNPAESQVDFPPENQTDEQILFSFILNDKTYFDVTSTLYLNYQNLYSGVDVESEFKKMVAWCFSNPNLRKTRNGALRFINNWLNKSQNGAFKNGNNYNGQTKNGTSAQQFAEARRIIKEKIYSSNQEGDQGINPGSGFEDYASS